MIIETITVNINYNNDDFIFHFQRKNLFTCK